MERLILKTDRFSGTIEAVHMRLIKYTSALICTMVTVFSASAEFRVWELSDGRGFEAELVNVFAGEAAFKMPGGEVRKIPLDRFSNESRVSIELEKPPKLSLGFIKDNDSKIFPQGINPDTQRPKEVRSRYGVRVKQTSTGDYNHELHIELFVIGKERLGEKYILLDRNTASFFLTDENRKQFEMRNDREVTLRNFTVGGSVRGEKYHGYLVIVKDT
jgi:hypothetical protein